MAHIPRILIVEDQYFIALNCEMIIRSAGYECSGVAVDAREALQLAERERPDLILMDIRLVGDIDGIEAATDIYERLGIQSVFVSADSDELTRAVAQKAHPLGWLGKPYSGEALIDAMQLALQLLSVGKSPGSDTTTRTAASATPPNHKAAH
jgi:two-component system, response regulator PdtaR